MTDSTKKSKMLVKKYFLDGLSAKEALAELKKLSPEEIEELAEGIRALPEEERP